MKTKATIIFYQTFQCFIIKQFYAQFTKNIFYQGYNEMQTKIYAQFTNKIFQNHVFTYVTL